MEKGGGRRSGGRGTSVRVAQGGVGKSSRLFFSSALWAITACDVFCMCIHRRVQPRDGRMAHTIATRDIHQRLARLAPCQSLLPLMRRELVRAAKANGRPWSKYLSARFLHSARYKSRSSIK